MDAVRLAMSNPRSRAGGVSRDDAESLQPVDAAGNGGCGQVDSPGDVAHCAVLDCTKSQSFLYYHKMLRVRKAGQLMNWFTSQRKQADYPDH
jgi:hypothetical protein